VKKLVLYFVKCFTFVCCLCLPLSNVSAKDAIYTCGDVLQIAIPAYAFGVTLIKDDHEGSKQFAYSCISTAVVVNGLKYATDDTPLGRRPNGGRHSFPSGHTSSAFQGAFFLQKRYGWKYGVPAMALAGFTAYTRLHGKYHHGRDVAAGIGIAFLLNWIFVEKFNNENIQFGSSGDGINVTLTKTF